MNNLFLSYGHDEHSELAHKIKRDFEEIGYCVWLDEREIKSGNYWEVSIEKGISVSDWIVVLMTPHSMRRPDGVCLDEISYARYQGKPIAPVMVQQVQPPLSIARIQWLDMKKYKEEEIYQAKFQELLKVIKGEYNLGFEGEFTKLRDLLFPLENETEIGRHIDKFTGREWLIEGYKDWLNGEQTSRVLWLRGQAGIGKTALLARLTQKEPSVVGVHFFKYNDSDRRDPKRALCSLVYSLATQIPEYMQQLMGQPGFGKFQTDYPNKSVNALFHYLLVEPLNQIKAPNQRYALVIDALDEADDKSELLSVLGQEFDKIPQWLGLVISSRPDPNIARKLSKLQPFEINAKDDKNKKDLELYILRHLELYESKNKKQIVQLLLEKSEGVFLYVREVIRDVQQGRLKWEDLQSFPQGLTGIYLTFFERQFSDLKEYKVRYRPLLELIFSALEPLPLQYAETVLEWEDEYEREEILEGLGSLFRFTEDTIEPYHKSIKDWITNRNRSGDFFVSEKKGRQVMIKNGWMEYLQGARKMSRYNIVHLLDHLYQNNDWDKLQILMTDTEYIECRYHAGLEIQTLDFYERILKERESDKEFYSEVRTFYLHNRLRLLLGAF